MNTRWKRLVGLVLIVALTLYALPLGSLAHADETSGEGLSKSKTSSEYELSPAKDTTTITLSLPSEEYLDTFDIVFVVDSSNESQQWEPKATALMGSLLDEDLNINVGVVKFKGRAQDTIDAVSGGTYSELTKLSDETRSYIEEAISFNPDTDERSTCGNGTNIHSALLKAQAMLDASDTPADHKYVMLFTDGRAYIYDDGNGDPMCIYAQYHRAGLAPARLMNGGRPTISSTAQADKYHAAIPVGTYFFKDADLAAAFDAAIVRFGTNAHSAADFQLLYDSTNPELTGSSPYETACLYPDSGAAKVSTLGTAPQVYTNVAEFDTYFKSSSGVFKNYYVPVGVEGTPYLELSPLTATIDETAGTASYNAELNPNYWMFHVSSAEKALYLAGHAWTDLGENYHTIAIINDRGYNAGLETCKDFLMWLPENSELSAEVRDTSSVETLFSELENQLIYAVGKAVVTDEIPSYLDLVEDAYNGDPFQVVVGDETLTATKTGDNQWGFGTASGGAYPYQIEWDASARTFKFFINVPVENANAVKLNYQLKWNGTGEEDVDVDTNASTTIEYWPSNDPEGESTTEPYVSPKVIYRSTVDYKVTKAWSDANDKDGIRPESVEVQLYANGSAVGDPVTLTKAEDWTHTWEGLTKNENGEAIDYEVKEVSAPEGYTAAVKEDASGYEATVTNSHTPKTTPNKPGDKSKTDSKSKAKSATKPAAAKQKLPDTGDVASSVAWVAMAAMGTLGMGLHIRRRKDGVCEK